MLELNAALSRENSVVVGDLWRVVDAVGKRVVRRQLVCNAE